MPSPDHQKRLTPDDLEAITSDQLSRAEKTASGEFPCTSNSDAPTIKIVECIREMCNQLGVPQDSPDLLERLIEKIKGRNDFDYWHAVALQMENIVRRRAIAKFAHDLRNALVVVLANADTALTYDLPAEIIELLEEGKRGAEIALNLSEKMLDTAIAQDKPNKRMCNISDLIQPIVRCAEKNHRNIEISSNLEPNCVVFADRGQIQRAIHNLINNSIESMPEGGQIILETKLYHDGDPEEVYIRITVHDTGHGIPRKDQSKVFDPYFTTKEGAGGTGLGLANVKKIVETHGGYVTLVSQTGEGSFTEFKIFLPAKKNAEPQIRPTEYSHVLRKGDGQPK